MLSREILDILQSLGELIPRPLEGPILYTRRLRGYSDTQIYGTIHRMEKQKWVKKKIDKGKTKYTLTDLGRSKALAYGYSRLTKKRRKDGMSTVVIFDIPESKKKSRDFLRRFLNQNNFVLLQKSVFIGPIFLQPEFRGLLNELKIEKNVTILEAKIIHTI
ncbi:MAG: CRISPR-associated endonuclease Cas2 [bacterium]|nr:CRISPR-associated endonuclease Cas2 [bacterium]